MLNQAQVAGQCDLIGRIQSGEHKYITDSYFSIRNTGEFNGGKLVSLRIYIPFVGSSFAQAASDVSEKLGSPAKIGTSVYQNRLGGRLTSYGPPGKRMASSPT